MNIIGQLVEYLAAQRAKVQERFNAEDTANNPDIISQILQNRQQQQKTNDLRNITYPNKQDWLNNRTDNVQDSWPQPDWEYSYDPGVNATPQGANNMNQYFTGQGPVNSIPNIGYENQYMGDGAPLMPQQFPVGFDYMQQNIKNKLMDSRYKRTR
jgi:hypothetical protein